MRKHILISIFLLGLLTVVPTVNTATVQLAKTKASKLRNEINVPVER
jgi:hypothetical protein